MAFLDYDKIAGRLDRAKGQGLISDYLVSWRGRAGRLKPKVTVWRNACAASSQLRDRLTQSLFGLVPAARILILDDTRTVD